MCGLFACSSGWEFILPDGIVHLHDPWSVSRRGWDFLALTLGGCRMLQGMKIDSKILLIPGYGLETGFRAEKVITYGLSPRDSLTFSSLQEPVLCVQRRLPLRSGENLEPQEFPMSEIYGKEELLPYLGARIFFTGSPYDGREQKMRKIP